MAHLPKIVFRYRTFSSTTVDLLCNDQQYFATPSTFNDPFDSSPAISIDSSIPRLKDVLKELVTNRVRGETLAAMKNAKVAEVQAALYAEKVAKREAFEAVEYIAYHATNPEYDNPMSAEIAMMHFDIQTELRGRYGKGICCFSEEYNNPLLWSHYADQHRGICIGYTLDRRPKPELKQVQYGGSRTVLTSLLEKALIEKRADAMVQLDADVLLRKAPEWSYEKEWRLIGNIGLQNSPLKLTEITFGYRCSAAVQHTLMKALEGRPEPIKFFEITNIPGTFQLERILVDFEKLMIFPRVAESGIEMFGDAEERLSSK